MFRCVYVLERISIFVRMRVRVLKCACMYVLYVSTCIYAHVRVFICTEFCFYLWGEALKGVWFVSITTFCNHVSYTDNLA